MPEIRAYMAKARLRRGIEIVKLANRIEALKMQEDEEQDVPQEADTPSGALETAGHVLADQDKKPIEAGLKVPDSQHDVMRKRSLSKIAKTAIFREVVLAKVRDMKAEEEKTRLEKEGPAPPVPKR